MKAVGEKSSISVVGHVITRILCVLQKEHGATIISSFQVKEMGIEETFKKHLALGKDVGHLCNCM